MKSSFFIKPALFFATVLLLLPLSAAAQDLNPDFYPVYVAPGYMASEFLTLDSAAAAIEFDADKNLYTSFNFQEGEHWAQVKVLYAATGYNSQSDYAVFNTDAYGINGLAFDNAGRLFVSEFDAPGEEPQPENDWGYLRVIDESGGTTAPLYFQDYRPTGVAAFGDSQCYYSARKWSDPEFGEIHLLDYISGADSVVREDLAATAIAVNEAGRLFVGLQQDNSIWTSNPVTGQPFQVARFNKYVEELNFDWDGHLYVLEARQSDHPSMILRLSPGGIDVKPGSFPNCFNQNGHGVIPVAVLGSETMNVNEINVSTLHLQGLNVKMAGKSGKYLAHTEDVNSDGYPDLMVKFQDSDGWIEPGHGLVMIKGYMNNGTAFWAMDTICIVPPKK